MSRTFTAHNAASEQLQFRTLTGYEHMRHLFEFQVRLLDSQNISAKTSLSTSMTVEVDLITKLNAAASATSRAWSPPLPLPNTTATRPMGRRSSPVHGRCRYATKKTTSTTGWPWKTSPAGVLPPMITTSPSRAPCSTPTRRNRAATTRTVGKSTAAGPVVTPKWVTARTMPACAWSDSKPNASTQKARTIPATSPPVL